MAESSQSISPKHQGNVKLIGIAGVVKGAKFSVQQGKSKVLGRSRDCDICLRELPAVAELAEKSEDYERHFHTVSRKHAKITYHEYGNVEITDLSSNGTYIDGKRVENSVMLTDLEQHPHELRLGTSVIFQLDWWRLVPIDSVKMPKVKVKQKKEEEAPEEESKEESSDGSDSSASSSADAGSDSDTKIKSSTSSHKMSDFVHEDTDEAGDQEEEADTGEMDSSIDEKS